MGLISLLLPLLCMSCWRGPVLGEIVIVGDLNGAPEQAVAVLVASR